MPRNYRWECPNGCGAVLAPERPRRDDIRRYCLPCSAREGYLVHRHSNVLDLRTAKSKARSAARAAAKRRKEAAKRGAAREADRTRRKERAKVEANEAAQAARRQRMITMSALPNEELGHTLTPAAHTSVGSHSTYTGEINYLADLGVPITMSRTGRYYIPRWARAVFQDKALTKPAAEQIVRWLAGHPDVAAAVDLQATTTNDRDAVAVAVTHYPFPIPPHTRSAILRRIQTEEVDQ